MACCIEPPRAENGSLPSSMGLGVVVSTGDAGLDRSTAALPDGDAVEMDREGCICVIVVVVVVVIGEPIASLSSPVAGNGWLLVADARARLAWPFNNEGRPGHRERERSARWSRAFSAAKV